MADKQSDLSYQQLQERSGDDFRSGSKYVVVEKTGTMAPNVFVARMQRTKKDEGERFFYEDAAGTRHHLDSLGGRTKFYGPL